MKIKNPPEPLTTAVCANLHNDNKPPEPPTTAVYATLHDNKEPPTTAVCATLHDNKEPPTTAVCATLHDNEEPPHVLLHVVHQVQCADPNSIESALNVVLQQTECGLISTAELL